MNDAFKEEYMKSYNIDCGHATGENADLFDEWFSRQREISMEEAQALVEPLAEDYLKAIQAQEDEWLWDEATKEVFELGYGIEIQEGCYLHVLDIPKHTLVLMLGEFESAHLIPDEEMANCPSIENYEAQKTWAANAEYCSGGELNLDSEFSDEDDDDDYDDDDDDEDEDDDDDDDEDEDDDYDYDYDDDDEDDDEDDD